MKHLLVTGGFGFIGSHLIEKLLAEGYHIHVVDNLSSSPLPLRELMWELGNPYQLSASICTVAEYCRFPKLPKFDGIYHLASPVGPAGVLRYAGDMIEQVTLDTYAVLRLALKQGIRLVDVSTSEVYGGGQNGLCGETMPRIIQAEATVRLEYAMAKLGMETAITNYCTVHNLNAVIIRPFNVAGPRQSGVGGFVLPRFVDAAMKNEDLPVFGDGKQIRAFTDVRDIVDGLILAMKHGRKGEVYNLGNPANKTTILALAERVLQNLPDSRSTVVFTDGKKIFGPLYREAADKYPDSSKALRELKWEPSISIDQTILDLWDYERNKSHIEQELMHPT